MSKEVIVTVKADTKSAQKNVKDLNKDLKDTKGDLSGVENLADKATGGLVSGFKGVTSTIGGVVKGFKTMRMAIIATGIGALVLVISSLTAAFTSSEEGANKFNKILGVLGAVVDNFIDLLADLGEGLISAFENPKEALMSFVTLLKNQVVNRITGLMELIPQLGKAVQLVFEGEFSEAGKVATNAVGKIALGVEDVTGKIQAATQATKEFIEENIKDAEGAARVADMRAKATKLERELLVERSKLESEIANLRLKSRQEEEFGAAERKQALLDAQKLEDQLLQKETEVLKLRRDAQVEENTFARSSVENLDKEAQAIAAVNRIAATRANQQRTTQRELNTLNKQIAAENKRIANEKKAQDDAELKRKQEALEADRKALAIKKAAEEKAKQEELEMTNSKLESENKLAIERKRFDAEQIEDELEKLERLKEIDAEEQELESKRLQDVINNANAGTKAKIDAEIAYNEFLEKSRQQNLTRDKEIADKKVDIQEKMNKEFYDAFWENANKILEDDKKITEARIDLKDALVNATSSALTSIANLAGEGTKIAKVAAIADIIIGTGVGFIQGLDIAQKSAKATGPGAAVAFPIFYATQVAAVLSAAAQAKNVLSKAKGPQPPSVSPPSIGGGGATTSPSQAPSFNVVGQSGFNQIAGALGQQPPTQAFVVAGDVTTAQQLQNNTITQATF